MGRKNKARQTLPAGLKKKRASGFEPPTTTLATCLPTVANHNGSQRLTDSEKPPRSTGAADSTDKRPSEGMDADLAAVISVWPNLPGPIKAAVVTLVNAAAGQEMSRTGAGQ